MASEWLTFYDRPKIKNARLVLGFNGWMDGGEVSTGIIDYLVLKLRASKLASIDPAPFYLYNLPGTMEMAAMLRPYTKISNGLISDFQEPVSSFYYDMAHNLILFSGKEPNLHWRDYAQCIFTVAGEFDVKLMSFAGSVAGLVPHTREPRISCSVSSERLLHLVHDYGFVPSSYEGPASFVTYLTALARHFNIDMVALVAEVPAYVQGKNPKCILAVLRKILGILDVPLDMNDLRVVSRDFEKRLTDSIQQRPELIEQIRKIEEDYDSQVFNTTIDQDLKNWLERQGVRLD